MKRTEFYEQSEADREHARQKRALIAMIAVGAAGLIACAVLCLFVTRKNHGTLLLPVICVSVVAGWIVIFLSHAVYGEAKALFRHAELMLTGERETYAGRFEKTADVRRVKNGVTVRKVRLFAGERETLLNINEEKAAALPDAFTGTVETVYDFIAAYEVSDD